MHIITRYRQKWRLRIQRSAILLCSHQLNCIMSKLFLMKTSGYLNQIRQNSFTIVLFYQNFQQSTTQVQVYLQAVNQSIYGHKYIQLLYDYITVQTYRRSLKYMYTVITCKWFSTKMRNSFPLFHATLTKLLQKVCFLTPQVSFKWLIVSLVSLVLLYQKFCS